MRVLLVDDHPIVQESMGALLKRVLQFASLFIASSLEQGIDLVRRHGEFDLVVLDIGLPGYTHIEALNRFRQTFPAIAVLVFSAIVEGTTVCDAIRAGAKGYILKTSSLEVIGHALRLVISGGIYIPAEALRSITPSVDSSLAVNHDVFGLTARQAEVLGHIVCGMTNRQIAQQLEISENTVKQHVQAIFNSLGVSTRVEALITAKRWGMDVVRPSLSVDRGGVFRSLSLRAPTPK